MSIRAAAAARPEFSLVHGGPLRRLGERVRFRGRPLGPLELGVALAMLAWVPLLCLAVIERLGPSQEGAGVSSRGGP